MLDFHRKIEPPVEVVRICHRLQEAGYQSFLVGGAVRDCFRGFSPQDWDIATDARPEDVARLFSVAHEVGRRFGTIVVQEAGRYAEITTFRTETSYSDGRRPDVVTFGNDIELDLSRRDFTVNAIAYDPLKQRLYDPFGGLRDIRRRRLRTVGDPKQRFGEDALRMLRLVRFTAQLQFRPERKTLEAIEPGVMPNVSWERVGHEVMLTLTAKLPGQALTLLYETGLMKEIMPELAACATVPQGSRHHLTVLGHSIAAAEMVQPLPHLRLAALLHDLGKAVCIDTESGGNPSFHGHDVVGAELARVLMQRLRLSSGATARVCHLIRNHMFAVHPHSTDRAIRRFIAKVGREHVLDLFELRRADILAMRHNPQQALEYVRSMRARMDEVLGRGDTICLRDLAVDGNKVMQKLRIPPGPLVGTILEELLEAVIDDPSVNTEQQLLQRAEQIRQKKN